MLGHAAVDGEVEGVGEADDHVDEEGDVAHQVVVQEVVGDAANREHEAGPVLQSVFLAVIDHSVLLFFIVTELLACC